MNTKPIRISDHCTEMLPDSVFDMGHKDWLDTETGGPLDAPDNPPAGSVFCLTIGSENVVMPTISRRY